MDIEVRETARRGRGLFALRDLSEGELVARYSGVMATEAEYREAWLAGLTSGVYITKASVDGSLVLDAEDEATGEHGVQVHAIYEPKQESTSDEIVLVDDPEGDEKLAKVAGMLSLVRVGVMIGHPAREYVFSVNEIMLASRLHAAAVEADPENGVRFVTMKSRPVLETEADIDGVATVEAYQVTDQCVGLVKVEAFSQAKTDPRVAKTKADCCFIVEKKEQRKATVEHFVARVFDVRLATSGP